MALISLKIAFLHLKRTLHFSFNPLNLMMAIFFCSLCGKRRSKRYHAQNYRTRNTQSGICSRSHCAAVVQIVKLHSEAKLPQKAAVHDVEIINLNNMPELSEEHLTELPNNEVSRKGPPEVLRWTKPLVVNQTR
jgi:hypothetical protein